MGIEAIAFTSFVAAAFIVLCGFWLFNIGSSLINFFRKYGVYFAIIFAAIAAFHSLLPTLLELLEAKYLAITAGAAVLALCFFGFEMSIVKTCLLEPKRKKSRTRGRMSGWSVLLIIVSDIVASAMMGAAQAMCFIISMPAGLIASSALVLFAIPEKINLVVRYSISGFDRRENLASLYISLLAQIAAAFGVYFWARPHFELLGVIFAVFLGYLVYLCISRIFVIVKNREKQ